MDEDFYLKEPYVLRKGSHIYTYDPAGFELEEDDRSPIFKVNCLVISIDEFLSRNYEGNAFLVCGCDRYKEKERLFEEGKSYTHLQEHAVDFGWDVVATCNHIMLLKRYFARPFLEEVLKAVGRQFDSGQVAEKFVLSREASVFPKARYQVLAEYTAGL